MADYLVFPKQRDSFLHEIEAFGFAMKYHQGTYSLSLSLLHGLVLINATYNQDWRQIGHCLSVSLVATLA